MKRLIITICALLFLTSLSAHRRVIELTKDRFKTGDRLSIPIALSAYQDGSTIYLYSNLPLKNLQVTIKNGTGEVISEETILILPQQSYAFYTEKIEEGTYILELNDGEEKYYGYFEIIQSTK